MAGRIWVLLALAPALLLSVLPIGSAQGATGPGRAVVLVSGFDTVTPFSTPDPACAGQEGPGWNPPGGVAQALKGAGFTVFTAPVMQGGGTPAVPCAPGTPTPPLSNYINSNGELNSNGQALGQFLAFLKDNYGITDVDFVAHSDGGLWSRAAITQQSNYPGVTVSSLTTLGTPYTGSFIADLSQDFSNGTCKAPNQIAQLVCLALQNVVSFVVKDLGEVTVEELSSDYLATWNPEQRIGSCPVTGIAGTFFSFPIDPDLLPAYYNPSDGLVGEASAQGQESKSIYGTEIPAPGIPNFKSGGEFPVVHGSSFSFLSDQNLLNQATISTAVVATLNSQPLGGPPCTTGNQPPTLTDGSASATIPLNRYAASRAGTLPRPRRGDQVIHRPRIRIFCGGKRLRSIPFFGNAKLRVTFPRCKKRLRVRGRRGALLIRPHGEATIKIRGRNVAVDVRGVQASNVVLRLEGTSRWRRIPLDGSGEGTLPAGSGPTTLRVIVTTRRGARLNGSAAVSR